MKQEAAETLKWVIVRYDVYSAMRDRASEVYQDGYDAGKMHAGQPAPAADTGQAVAWNCIYPTYGHFTLKPHEAEQAKKDGATVIPLGPITHPAPLDAERVREDWLDELFPTMPGQRDHIRLSHGAWGNAPCRPRCPAPEGGQGMIQGFSVYRRNYGHWDISSKEYGRLFRLRGGPGQWDVIDERTGKGANSTMPPPFKDQSAAMAYICAELMHELLTVEGQEPHVMENWNIDWTNQHDHLGPSYPDLRQKEVRDG